ncbi:hypothetical protein KBY83_02595 [Cyanobium sp. WKJ7-Wakatipu]|uniref:hypothetical protein n=1 Tax=Cyanobium sp. WKJ7-Wakatipu TaxID=2823726 RepID=UPI0020CCF8CA|nr:hypothetical protein [Cyanobium sp. WKJ7-Wakatipu]MCP9782210.1 hypothetical protein [Cyanobium sp. WKJ7-Wakatipu]
MTIAIRTSVAISSGGISAQLIRLLPPAGCPGEAVWVPPNEVQRWEQLGFGRAPIPAAELELSWQPAGPESGGLIPIEMLLNPRHTPPNSVTVDWGDGVTETLPWPVGGDGNGRLRHGYISRRDYTITAELSGSGVTATLLVSLAGCPIWQPEVTPPPDGGGGGTAPGSVLPLIPGAGLSGAAYDGSTTQQWSLTRWSGGSSAGGVPASDGSSSLFLCADGTWAMPSGGGTRWFNGAGPPPLTISDANPGDYYLDNLSGNFYVLEG